MFLPVLTIFDDNVINGVKKDWIFQDWLVTVARTQHINSLRQVDSFYEKKKKIFT